MERTQRRRVLIGATVVALVAALVLWWMLRDGEEPQRATLVPVVVPTPTPTPKAPADPCAKQSAAGFVPTTISVEGVVRRAEVIAVPRDAAGVPGVPPVAEKSVFAWDLGGVEPGSGQGNVLLNTHTWPDGSAMGNRLLAGLEVGGALRLGRPGEVACYRVTERVEVPFQDGFPGYKATDGPPQVVIIVCSGRRLGPGHWTHRTLWFAAPVR